MNSGITRLTALVLLIVAVGGEDWVGKHVGSVKLTGKNSRVIGAINLWQPTASQKQVYMYANMSNIPDGTYIAVVHKCIWGDDNVGLFGPARASSDQTGDVTKGRRPMTLFRRVFSKSTSRTFTGIVEGIALKTYTAGDITENFIGIYRDTPAGLKLCSQSQNTTAELVASGYVSTILLGSDRPKIPSLSNV